MSEIAANILGPLFTDAAKWVASKIKRQFSYLFCFTTIITTLEQEAKDLEDSTQDLQAKVDRATNEALLITHAVETWLTKSKVFKNETDGILNEAPNVGSGCLKLGARFSLGRRAVKTTDRLKEHRSQCIFDDAIAQPRLPAAMKAVPLGTTYEFESRKHIEEDIMASLVGGDLNTMGICGMGGLGKTTMAKKIMNTVLENKLFDEVVMAVVSQPPVNKLRIQIEIGVSLGLNNLKDETSEIRAAQELHARLSGTKRILLVLDDVWEKLVLEDLGIPCNHKGSVILLTSRNSDVLRAMNVPKVFGMKELSDEDAWFLFREKAGTIVDDTKLNSVAKEVVNESKGLPMALATVGAALKDEKNVRAWKDALRQLKQSDPDIPEWIADFYGPLKLSYDFVGSKQKSVLLLCCLYPEDAEIPLERLTYFCMGLGIFEGGIKNVEEARNKMFTLTNMLKNRSLLLDSNRKGDDDSSPDDYVRMHDVVRDVCIFIAKQEGCIGVNNCTYWASTQRFELSIGTGFPNLHLLFLIRNSANEEEFKLESNFFEGIKDLHVLSIERLSLKSLPQTTQSLKNLNTLVLDSCKKLETLSVVGELVNLQILVCRGCNSIKELPLKMKGLKELKLLDLTRCTKLQRIGRGIISSLVGLEELKMLHSFQKWEGEDREERENAGLRELEVLTKLRCLEIEIQDHALAAEDMHFSSKLDSFDIRFSSLETSVFSWFRSSKKIYLCLNKERRLGHWIEMQLLRDTECLHSHGNGVNNVNLANAQNIKWLELHACDSVKEIETKWFSSIEHLKLVNLPKLEKIWDDQISLPQLKVLIIRRCTMMEQVFLWEGESRNSHHITKIFSKLEEVDLNNLPNVTSFYQGIEGIEFPQLRKLTIERCGKMKSTVSKWMGINENNVGDSSKNKDTHKPEEGLKDEEKGMSGDQTTLLFPKLQHLYLDDLRELVSFCEWNCEDELPSLSYVRIRDCPNMKQLCKSSSLHQNGQTKDCLRQLEWLRIQDCKMMEQVFLWNGEDGNENYTSESLNSHHITKVIPNVKEVELCNLPNLTSFYQGIEAIEFPQLHRLEIRECRKMKRMVSKGMEGNENNWGGTRSNEDIHHLSCQPQKEVSFGCLKNLTTDWNPFGGIIHVVSVFGGLERLRIDRCGGGTSSITSSIATTLVNLRELTIWFCEEMVRVIEDGKEKEKVVSDSGQSTLRIFPKLEILHLWHSRKLESFCEWKCDVGLPSLREVDIYNCGNMKYFSLGRLVTPNLKIVRIDYVDYGDVGGVEDLNGVVQQWYEKKQKEMEEKGVDQQAQERKGEIEEQKN